MKICPKCGKESGLESTQHRSYCNKCWSEYQSDWYKRSPRRRLQVLDSNKRRRAGNREYIIAQKSKPCMDCNKTYPYFVMDFDHVRGEKKYCLSVSNRLSREKIDEELAKCDLVCANCHRIRTFSRACSPADTTSGYEPLDLGAHPVMPSSLESVA